MSRSHVTTRGSPDSAVQDTRCSAAAAIPPRPASMLHPCPLRTVEERPAWCTGRAVQKLDSDAVRRPPPQSASPSAIPLTLPPPEDQPSDARSCRCERGRGRRVRTRSLVVAYSSRPDAPGAAVLILPVSGRLRRHRVSVAKAHLDGSVGGRPGEADVHRRWRRWRLAAAGMLALVLAAVAVVAELAEHYQPLAFGGTGYSNGYFPGLPTGTGIQDVNTFGDLHEDTYIPPQRGTFSLFIDLANSGGEPVTIQAVTLQQPGQAVGPLSPAGPVRYARPDWWSGANATGPWKSRILRSVELGPGQDIYVGVPVRMWPCAQRGSWISVPSFYVRYRFLLITRTVALPWGMKGDQLIMNGSGGQPGQPGIFCAAQQPHTHQP
jgi:hypothetical protein